MTNISDNHVKVHFWMAVDEDGWPPAGVESLWAVVLGDGTVRLDNTPWYVRGVASDDIVRVYPKCQASSAGARTLVRAPSGTAMLDHQ